jgi:hypothetical protein
MQCGREMEVAVVAGFPAEGDMNVNARHVDVYALWM